MAEVEHMSGQNRQRLRFAVGKGRRDLDEKAIEAVVQWKFTPPRADCSFYEKRLTVEVNFRLL
jgi:outer membrane biosynthesis protein TonB